MFNRMLSAFGIGGPSVDTVLDSPYAVPGQALTGQVRVQGGSADTEIGQVVLSLVIEAEGEHGDGGTAEFSRLVVQQGVRVPAGELVAIPFQLPLPWETPITAVGGSPLPRMAVGVRTELVIAGAPDKGDLDPVQVGPLPAQNKVLDAFGQLGFSFRGTGVVAGRAPGVAQELGFRQALRFACPAQYAGRVEEVELTFVAGPHELCVLLAADRRGGMFSPGGDTFGQFRLSHQEAQVTDWASLISGWLAQAAERRQVNPAFGGGHGGHNPAFGSQPGYGQPGYGAHQGYDHPGQQQRGPGMGGMLAAGAAGVVGGVVLGEVAEEMFGDDE
ncbi:sporulation protein [Crossiella sp. CA-258035]|uniref:sporulation protein n=1 Tax=Crossiella sp. CA-258035 TaxID=2981138 RepID=UPI0024BC3B0B|nr:sporulation protein [Crossiella sp. CA-258035]WHT23295.1 sporulation protein [Crossiella sp. CA-258035]